MPTVSPSIAATAADASTQTPAVAVNLTRPPGYKRRLAVRIDQPDVIYIRQPASPARVVRPSAGQKLTIKRLVTALRKSSGTKRPRRLYVPLIVGLGMFGHSLVSDLGFEGEAPSPLRSPTPSPEIVSSTVHSSAQPSAQPWWQSTWESIVGLIAAPPAWSSVCTGEAPALIPVSLSWAKQFFESAPRPLFEIESSGPSIGFGAVDQQTAALADYFLDTRHPFAQYLLVDPGGNDTLDTHFAGLDRSAQQGLAFEFAGQMQRVNTSEWYGESYELPHHFRHQGKTFFHQDAADPYFRAMQLTDLDRYCFAAALQPNALRAEEPVGALLKLGVYQLEDANGWKVDPYTLGDPSLWPSLRGAFWSALAAYRLKAGLSYQQPAEALADPDGFVLPKTVRFATSQHERLTLVPKNPESLRPMLMASPAPAKQ